MVKNIDPVDIISLGWGVQSFTLAVMSALGDLPRVYAAVHADTTHERSDTYRFAQQWTPWLEAHGVQVVTVRGKRTDAIADAYGGVFVPAYTTYEDGRPSGVLKRQCTGKWKIAPIRRWIRAHLGLVPIRQWLGITLDEASRVRPSDVQYITNTYPFLDMLSPRWTRLMCADYLTRHGIDIPPKSACYFCPYHDLGQWKDLKQNAPQDWDRAIAVDQAIRHKRPGYVAYLSNRRIPLEELGHLLDAQDTSPTQLSLNLWDDECTGYCGV